MFSKALPAPIPIGILLPTTSTRLENGTPFTVVFSGAPLAIDEMAAVELRSRSTEFKKGEIYYLRHRVRGPGNKMVFSLKRSYSKSEETFALGPAELCASGTADSIYRSRRIAVDVVQ